MADLKATKWAVGDIVRLKKPHPCGGYEWQILRIGLDFRIQCQTCQRYFMLPRQEFNKKVKAIVKKVEEDDSSVSS